MRLRLRFDYFDGTYAQAEQLFDSEEELDQELDLHIAQGNSYIDEGILSHSEIQDQLRIWSRHHLQLIERKMNSSDKDWTSSEQSDLLKLAHSIYAYSYFMKEISHSQWLLLRYQ